VTKPVVIVGSGLAGYAVAREFRKLNSEQELVIITADGGESYSKPMLSNAFSAGKDKAALTLASAPEMAEKLNATLLTESRVRAIEVNQRQLWLDGAELSYDKLVLAVGASALKIEYGGDAADADNNGAIQLTDGIFILNFLFLGGEAPPAPGLDCGEDTDDPDDALGCETFDSCGG